MMLGEVWRLLQNDSLLRQRLRQVVRGHHQLTIFALGF